uniref:Ovule protein n=1 Tax=Haemonchus contortus TaxID=6289 RepID=A0A7I4YRP0_HAECO
SCMVYSLQWCEIFSPLMKAHVIQLGPKYRIFQQTSDNFPSKILHRRTGSPRMHIWNRFGRDGFDKSKV